MRDNIKAICSAFYIDYSGRHLSTHSLRAFFNTYLESKNISDAKIKAVIGHKDSTMTGNYTYWKPDMFTDIHEVQNKLYMEILCQE
jgi:integrase